MNLGSGPEWSHEAELRAALKAELATADVSVEEVRHKRGQTLRGCRT
jgi:hypothetical protein